MRIGTALPPSEWQPADHLHSSSQAMAFLRAAVIVLALLGVLVAMILM